VITPRDLRPLLRLKWVAGTAGLLVAVLLAMVLLPHVLSTGQDGMRSNVLRRGNGPEPESLDPHGARSEAALTILRDLDEGLTEIGSDGIPVLAAADGVEVSADQLTYSFHLRPEARWSNGEAVVAEDFAAAWRRLLDPHTGAQYADILSAVRGATQVLKGAGPTSLLGIYAADAHTLIVELTQPTPYFLSILAHPATFPINRAALAAHGRGFAKPGNFVSNGAFVLARWDFGSHLVAVRNTFYWNDAKTRLSGVEYYSYPDADSELRAFRTGQVDTTASVPSAQATWIHDHLGHELQVAPQLAVYFLGFNLRKAAFGESRALRQALSLVIDREQLVRSVTGGGETPAYTFVPPQTRGYTPPVPEYAGWPMRKRVEFARRLLRDAGPAQLPPIELRYNSGELHNRIAIAVAHMWKESLGIDATLRAEEFKVLLQDIDRGEAGVFRASWIGDYDDAYTFLQVLRRGFGINTPHYASPTYDDLLDRAAASGDPLERCVLLQRAEAAMLDDQPVIPLYFYVSKHLVSTRVQGWQSNVMNIVYSKNLSKPDVETGN
jgi:oligopeptide transport system substrate-binding protein